MRSQRGAVLLMGLIFSLAALLLTVGAITAGIYQQRIASSTKDRELAFQAAEAALRDAEMSIMCKVYTAKSDMLGQCVAGDDGSAASSCMPGCGTGSPVQNFGLNFETFDASRKLCPFGRCTSEQAPDATAPKKATVWESVEWSKERGLAPSPERSTVPIGYFTRHPGYADKSVVAGVVAQPRFLIEAPGNCDPSTTAKYCTYRITAMGWGNKNATVTLQELFRP